MRSPKNSVTFNKTYLISADGCLARCSLSVASTASSIWFFRGNIRQAHYVCRITYVSSRICTTRTLLAFITRKGWLNPYVHRSRSVNYVSHFHIRMSKWPKNVYVTALNENASVITPGLWVLPSWKPLLWLVSSSIQSGSSWSAKSWHVDLEKHEKFLSRQRKVTRKNYKHKIRFKNLSTSDSENTRSCKTP